MRAYINICIQQLTEFRELSSLLTASVTESEKILFGLYGGNIALRCLVSLLYLFYYRHTFIVNQF